MNPDSPHVPGGGGRSGGGPRASCARTATRSATLGSVLRELAPRAVVTCARGSSDHAATYAKYLIETRTGLLASSAAPSVSSLYARKPDLAGRPVRGDLAVGREPGPARRRAGRRKDAGALVVALVNAEDSPLARAADHTIPLRAGAETSVAATKSYIASLAAIVQLVAQLDAATTGCSTRSSGAPDQLERAWQLDWSAAIEPLRHADSLFVIGRGLGLGIAQEAALKLKETCGLHAEAFSAAEVRHGPMALVRPRISRCSCSRSMTRRGAGVEALARRARRRRRARPARGLARCPARSRCRRSRAHPAIEPLLMIQSFYRFANALAVARGRDPDRPPHLRKVTETV